MEPRPDVPPSPPPPSHARREGSRGNRPLVALLVFVVIAVAGWFLVRSMLQKSRMEDCFMSGRRNCAPVEGAEER